MAETKMIKKKGGKEVKEDKERKPLNCSNCGSAYVYVLSDATVVCRKCGHRKNPDKQKLQ